MGSFHKAALEEPSEQAIDIAPVNMIDLMLILLIFFIVSTTFSQESGMDLDRPQPSMGARLHDKKNVTISLTEKGEVLCDGREIGIGGVQQAVKQGMQKEQVPVIIRADAEAQTGMLVRVMDEARRAGAADVKVATVATRK